MRKFFFSVAVATIAFASGPVAADQRDGPYYATPSWDQQLSVSDRFVVLTNWNNEAVLDRETGLVWQRTPSGVSKDHNWALAVDACKDETTGGRFGWRLPAVEELSTLIDATTTTIPFAPPSGAPFTLPPGPTAFWTATTFAQSPADAWQVFMNSFTKPGPQAKTTVRGFYWCVRGYQGTQSPQ